MFADLTASTAVAGRLEPDDWADIADRLLEVMSAPVARFGGTVTRLMGDGLLALFGAPEAHEDDAERAIRAGLAIITETAAARAAIAEENRALSLGADELVVRVGISTGPVVAGDVGGMAKTEYTAMGDTVNLAARLEQAARPGTVLIAETTRTLAGRLVGTGRQRRLVVKGKAEPVVACEIDAIPTAPVQRPTRAATVGRRSELRLLEAALMRLEAGHGTIVIVEGDAGLGKTRLLGDVRHLHDAGATWLEARCASYEVMVPYALGRRIIGGIVGGGDLTSHRIDPDRRRIIERMVSQTPSEEGSAPELRPRAVAAAVGELLASVIERSGPVVLLIDDLHWVDEASADLLIELFTQASRLPVAFVGGTRPQQHGPSGRVIATAQTVHPQTTTTIVLPPLSPVDAARLLRDLVSGVPLDGFVEEQVISRAGGNPYFLEELVDELLGRDPTIEGRVTALSLPLSLRSLLQAKFDRLDPQSRDVLAIAAVVGKTFSPTTIEEVYGADVDRPIAELHRAGIVEFEQPQIMTFRHALTQETAYASILRRDLRRLHQAVGETLEAIPHTDVALLAGHFLESGDASRAARYSLAAGDAAVALQAYRDALGHYQRGSTVAADDEVGARLRLGAGRAKTVTGDIDGGLIDLEAALDLARATGAAETEWQTLIALGELWSSRDYAATGGHYEAALDLARGGTDATLVAASLNRLGNWYVNASDPQLGVAMHREALEMFERMGSAEGVAASHDLLAMGLMLAGDRAAATEMAGRAAEEFIELGDKAGLAGTLIAGVIGAPNYEELSQPPLTAAAGAVADVTEALRIARVLEWPAAEAYARFMLSQVLATSGDLGGGLREARAALAVAELIGHAQWTVGSLLALGWVEADAFMHDDARGHFETALELARSIGSVNWTFATAGALALHHLLEGRPGTAAALAEEALTDPRSGAFLTARNCVLALGWAVARQGDMSRAQDLLGRLDPRAPMVALALADCTPPDRALDMLSAALQVAVDTGVRVHEWRIRLKLAGLTGLQAHSEAAGEILKSCVATLDEPDRPAMRAAVETLLSR